MNPRESLSSLHSSIRRYPRSVLKWHRVLDRESIANLHMPVFIKFLVLMMVFAVSFVLALGQTPRKPEQFYDRGVGRLEREDLAGALADFNKAIELLPKYSAAYSVRGTVKKKMGDVEGAVVDFTRSIELTPGFAIPYYNRGFL